MIVDGGAGGRLTGRICGDGSKRVAAIGKRGGIQRETEGRAGHSGAGIGSIHLELHAGGVGGDAGGDGDGSRNGCARAQVK